jgi:hypothetical protein
MPGSYVVVLGVLPRSGWTLPDQNAWPNRLSPAIEAINNASKVSRIFPCHFARLALGYAPHLGYTVLSVWCIKQYIELLPLFKY